MKAAHDAAALIPTINDTDYADLAADIAARGLMLPIVIRDGLILDGRARERACIEQNINARYVTLPDNIDAAEFVISVNLHRRHLDENQRAMVAARLTVLVRGSNRNAPVGALRQADAGKRLAVGRRSVQRARTVLDHGIPELVAAVDAGMLGITLAAKAAAMPEDHQRTVAATPPERMATVVKQLARDDREREIAERIETEFTRLGGMRRYGVILADPPWNFATYGPGGMDRAAANHYPTMGLPEISALAVPAADDCVLFLWATIPMLPQALGVLAAWGFDYRSAYVWRKPHPGTGYWSRNNAELLLVGAKGEVAAPAMGDQPMTIIDAPLGAHSAKPDVFAAMIDRMFPHASKVELFARAARAGWDSWGAERQEAA